ncbi:MAG: hypothetical protein IPH69_06590 [Bacteroidales bacterium]|nr:hypothetical protein [Bacteroidales bacterium]
MPSLISIDLYKAKQKQKIMNSVIPATNTLRIRSILFFISYPGEKSRIGKISNDNLLKNKAEKQQNMLK